MEQTIIFVAETVKQIRDVRMQDKTTNITHWIQSATHILKNLYCCKMFSITEVHLVKKIQWPYHMSNIITEIGAGTC